MHAGFPFRFAGQLLHSLWIMRCRYRSCASMASRLLQASCNVRLMALFYILLFMLPNETSGEKRRGSSALFGGLCELADSFSIDRLERWPVVEFSPKMDIGYEYPQEIYLRNRSEEMYSVGWSSQNNISTIHGWLRG